MSILWLVDRGSPREGLAALPGDSQQNIIVYIDRTTDYPSLAAQVGQRVTTPVQRVRIVSHGNSGQLNFSNGLVTAGNVGALAFLRGRVRPNGLGVGVEI